MTVLVQELGSGPGAPFADHAALDGARRHLENEVLPALRRVFPVQAVQSWIAPYWQSLARRAVSLAFRGCHADSHAVPLWLLAGDWASAAQAVEGIDVWWHIPAPLAGRLGEARVQRDRAEARATALLGEILRREHEGDRHELVSLRQALSRLHVGLFEVYMATRKVRHR